MAGPASQPPQQAPRPIIHPKLLRYIAATLLVLIILVALAVLITWLTIKPKRLVYTIENGSVQAFNMTNTHLNATFNFVIRSYNPNTKISIYYDSMWVSVAYDDQIVAFDVVEPFFQPHRNVTRLEVKPVAQYVTLLESVAKDMRHEKSSGKVELSVWVKARVKFKVGVWKSRDRTLRISCSPVVVHFSSSESFGRTYCNEELQE